MDDEIKRLESELYETQLALHYMTDLCSRTTNTLINQAMIDHNRSSTALLKLEQLKATLRTQIYSFNANIETELAMLYITTGKTTVEADTVREWLNQIVELLEDKENDIITIKAT